MSILCDDVYHKGQYHECEAYDELAGKRYILRLLFHPAFLNGISLHPLNTAEHKVSHILFLLPFSCSCFSIITYVLNFRATQDKPFVRI
jgi:hypothetical protein